MGFVSDYDLAGQSLTKFQMKDTLYWANISKKSHISDSKNILLQLAWAIVQTNGQLEEWGHCLKCGACVEVVHKLVKLWYIHVDLINKMNKHSHHVTKDWIQVDNHHDIAQEEDWSQCKM